MSATVQTYEREPYRRTLDTEIVAAGDDGGRPWAVLSDTILFPEGGGQPADHGRLNDVAVVEVRKAGGEIRHLLDGPVVPGPVTVVLDWPRRYDHMQQHSAQHLLTALALDHFGWPTTAFHLQPEVCDIELGVASPSEPELLELEELVATEIRAARPVTTRRVSAGEAATLDVRSRGLPADHAGDIRLVEIEGIDLNTCGGTHVASTAELEAVKLLGSESIRGGTRLFWVAGSRVRCRLGRHEARNAELRRVFDTADDRLSEIASLKLAQLKDALRREKTLLNRLADAEAASLAAAGRPVVAAHFDAADAAFLSRVARSYCGALRAGVAFLTAAGEKGTFFTLAAGESSGVDVSATGRRIAEILQGRGGGSGVVFQGKAGSLVDRDRALEVLNDLRSIPRS